MSTESIINNSGNSELPVSILTRHQTKTKTYRLADGSKLKIELRLDDECKNGHNSFAITGEYWYPGSYGREPDTCGCIHDIIEKYAPEIRKIDPEAPDYRKYIKWHLCSTDAPMHYVANTVYNAGNRDCWGYAPGEPCRFGHGVQFSGSQVTHYLPKKFIDFLRGEVDKGVKEFTLMEVPHINKPGDTYEYGSHYSVNNFTNVWHEAPFKNITEGQEFVNGLNMEWFMFVKLPVEYSKGKERDFAAARHCAIGADLTDEQLSLPSEELAALLKARLPALMWEFKTAMEELGFTY